ncbi:MAG TPA: hypothetical protein VIH38_10305, partial [Steroidobacteraceae bacterium]
MGQGSLAQRLVSAPCVGAAKEAHAQVDGWLAEISGTSAGTTLARLVADHPTFYALIAGVTE